MNNTNIENFIPDEEFFRCIETLQRNFWRKPQNVEDDVRLGLLESISSREQEFTIYPPDEKEYDDTTKAMEYLEKAGEEVLRLGGTFTIEEHDQQDIESCPCCNFANEIDPESSDDSDQRCAVHSYKDDLFKKYVNAKFEWIRTRKQDHEIFNDTYQQ